MHNLNPTQLTKLGGISLDGDLKTPLYLIDNERVMIHTRASLEELYKTTNLYDDEKRDWFENTGEKWERSEFNSLTEILDYLEDPTVLEEDYWQHQNKRYQLENFYIERII